MQTRTIDAPAREEGGLEEQIEGVDRLVRRRRKQTVLVGAFPAVAIVVYSGVVHRSRPA